MKLTVSKSKNSASFYVQKTIRKKSGPTTITVEKLGNLDEVRTKAGGKDPYVWAQEYVNELNRREYEEQRQIIVSRFCRRSITAWPLIRSAKIYRPDILLIMILMTSFPGLYSQGFCILHQSSPL